MQQEQGKVPSHYSSVPSLTKFYMQLPSNFSRFTGWRFPHIPRLKGNLIAGRIPHLLRENGILNNLFAAGDLAKQHESGMCYYWVGHKLVLIITKPEHVHQLLILNNKNAGRGDSFTMFRKFMGPSITVDPPEPWKIKQGIYSDWLSKTSILAKHEPQMLAVVNRYMNEIETTKQPINLQHFYNRFALEVLLNTVFFPNGDAPDCVDKLLDYHAYVTKEIFEYKNIFKWFMPSFLRRFIHGTSEESADEVCLHMRNSLNNILFSPNEEVLKTNHNFVRCIYELSHHDTGVPLVTDPNVFGDTNMMLLAGQDTNLATFLFAIKLIAAHPDVEKRLREELSSHLVNNEFNLDNINRVSYLDMILKETLRLYPPVPFIPRDVIHPFALGPVFLRKGDIVMFSPYLTHHHPSVWSKPDKFDPQRFDKKNKINQHAYLPFGAGAHACIGQRFALQELRLLLAAIYSQYTVKISDNTFSLSLAQGALKPSVPPRASFVPIKKHF